MSKRKRFYVEVEKRDGNAFIEDRKAESWRRTIANVWLHHGATIKQARIMCAALNAAEEKNHG